MPTQNISFDDSNLKEKTRIVSRESESPAIIKFLIKNKIAKNEKTAGIMLAIAASVLIVVSIFLIKKSLVTVPAVIDPSLNSINNAQ